MLMIKKSYNQRKQYAIVGVVIALGFLCLLGVYTSRVLSPSRQVQRSAGTKAPTLEQPGDAKILGIGAPVTPTSTNCTTTIKKRSGLAAASSLQLKKLAQYESVCGSRAVSRMSLFVPTPATAKEALAYAADVAKQLREFAQYGVPPVVFFEPTSASGNINLAAYRAGTYDTALDTYFKAIKQAGITDVMMGAWVPLPEGNLPEWSSLQPDIFAGCVTKAATYQKKYFPGSHVSIMLDTLTYTQPGNYDNGRAISLLPYVKGIPRGLVDSFGLQGFPWSPPLTQKVPSNGRPKDYLRIDLAVEAARALQVKYIWLNTGTFGVAYAGQKDQVAVSPQQRLALLDDVIAEVKTLQAQHFTVSVHLFGQDKSSSAEGIDWSYWHGRDYAKSASTNVFKTFAHKLQAVGAALWLFDV
jgi:hypothetical protein